MKAVAAQPEETLLVLDVGFRDGRAVLPDPGCEVIDGEGRVLGVRPLRAVEPRVVVGRNIWTLELCGLDGRAARRGVGRHQLEFTGVVFCC